MIRKILFFVLLSLLIKFSYSQKTEIIIDSTKTKNQIFQITKIWITNTWKSAFNVIQFEDTTTGVIIIKGGLSTVPYTMGVAGDGMTKTKITFTIRDKKVRLEFENTNFKWYASANIWTLDTKPSMSGKSYDKWKANTLLEIDSLIEDYKKALNKVDDF